MTVHRSAAYVAHADTAGQRADRLMALGAWRELAARCPHVAAHQVIPVLCTVPGQPSWLRPQRSARLRFMTARCPACPPPASTRSEEA